jgi:hypothetical protein
MIALTLSTVSISTDANQSNSAPPITKEDKWTYSVNFQHPPALVDTLSTEVINYFQRFLQVN